MTDARFIEYTDPGVVEDLPEDKVTAVDDPDRAITAVVYEPEEENFTKKTTVVIDPKKKTVKKKSTKKKAKSTKVNKIVEEVEPEPERPLVTVVFEGVFGKIQAGYTDVYQQNIYLVLVRKTDAEFVYTPPESDDIIEVTYRGMTKRAISPGISIDLKEQGISVTVLLLVNDTEED